MGSSILLNTTALGYLSYKVLLKLKNTDRKRFDELISVLKNYPGISEVINTLGSWDVEVDLEVRSAGEFNSTITLIHTHFRDLVLGYNTLLKYQEKSYNYWPVRQG